MNRIVEGAIKSSFGAVAYRHTNAGSTLPKMLLCHGWQDHLGIFEPLSKHLNDRFELFAFDYPGHGRSDHVTWPSNYGHSEQLKLVHEIRHHLKWDEMSIVAHSWAGNSLTPYVCMYPEAITHYVMLDAYGLITARDENFLAIYRASLDTAIEPHHPSERMRPREELRERVKRGTTIPESFIDAWIERACVFDEDGSNGRFVRDIRMTGPMIVPWYMSTMLKPEMLIDSLQTPTLKIIGSESKQGVDWSSNTNTMAFDQVR